MSTVTYRDGVATIIYRARKTEVHVSITASIIVEHGSVMGRASATDARALAAGYLHLAAENGTLRAELAAARAGTIGVEHAAAMQEARKVIADINKAAIDFMEEYERGDGPDGKGLLEAMSKSESWLFRDVKNSIARDKVLKGGAA